MRIATIAGIIAFMAASASLAADPSPQPTQFDPFTGFDLTKCLSEEQIPRHNCYFANYCTKKYKQLPKDGECSTLYGINR
jgi:hypothetical protein